MTLAGTWVNEYGSKMQLAQLNTNLVIGTYSSTTGSTGTYAVIGYQTSAEPTTNAGQAVALAIEWHSITGGQGDNSWHWVSGLSGQISIENNAESLVLAHAMVASTDFPGLATAGTYIDKLIYTRVSDERSPATVTVQEDASLADPMVGSWSANDGTGLLITNVTPYTNGEFGWVRGKAIIGGVVCEIQGVTDINAASNGLTLQSVAITALMGTSGPAVAFGGTLNLQTGVLTLLDLQSQPTAANATYVQTQVSSKTFTRN
ncbi:avidin/streptavidin family protein [Pedomonas mirosovicensis]|uniref:avidin/streptavidin family protein n=1 Tax=Pedomonas mirosovicensis TaxID=2908641 RepID=UPI0021690541|nr:avidin/streptavidin family protein [Pedomonas mirosovicensis]MCH8686531.1 avidin/streptavidin family protein [Pedomonas mirosovicensis]